jgi:serine/threonine protein kinase
MGGDRRREVHAEHFLILIKQSIAECRMPETWQAELEPQPEGNWIHVTNRNARTPQQGWKLHVSASVMSAESVLRAALPVLLGENISFKVASSLDTLSTLNDGRGGLSQVGKFVTVYPNDDENACRLAAALHAATSGLRGPVVPSDRPLKAGSLVHYRYGNFSGPTIQASSGRISSAILDPHGNLIADDYSIEFRNPAWVTDPFFSAGIADELRGDSRLVGGRYLMIEALNSSASGTVYLGVDILGERNCIIKEALREGAAATDGTDARQRLRNEASVLGTLSTDERFPNAFDLIEQEDNLYLVMEEIPGVTLAEASEPSEIGRRQRAKLIVARARELVSILAAIHSKGFVYCDLKSSNIIVAPNGRLRLIDFGITRRRGVQTSTDREGTPGYMSPQQRQGKPASIADDIFAFGAVLYFLITGAEPSLAPDRENLLSRPIELLTPGIDDQMVAIVSHCLHPTARKRYRSLAEVDAALEGIGVNPLGKTPSFGRIGSVESHSSAQRRYARLARRLGDTICSVARRDSNGCFWLSGHPSTDGMPYRDLSTGSSGAIIALAELVSEMNEPAHRAVLRDGAHHLITAAGPEGSRLAGLYVGESGIGAALLLAGKVLGDKDLIAHAARRSDMISSLPFAGSDLYNGAAGRVRFHLMLWSETGSQDHLEHARVAGERILAMATRTGRSRLSWVVTETEGDEDRMVAYVGYAHGVAGIADALLDLFEATRDEKYLTAARQAARWIIDQAIPLSRDEGGIAWPSFEKEEEASPSFWCHGAAGIGRFLVRCAELEVVPEASLYARGAAQAVARSTRWAGPTECHGLAGNIGFLLDAYQSTGERKYLNEAMSLARLLETFAREDDGLLVWSSESPDVASPDYLVGYAGVALALLRLSQPQRLPHLLSIRGFRRPRKKKRTRTGSGVVVR